MRLFYVEWENGTISVLSAEGYVDLFERLDEEGPPLRCRFAQIEFVHMVQRRRNGGLLLADEPRGLEWMLGWWNSMPES